VRGTWWKFASFRAARPASRLRHNARVPCAGLLLTGGSSRRLGTDKARLVVPGGETLAERTGRLLLSVADPAIEVGAGRTGLRGVEDAEPGAGPLAALAAGVAALDDRGWAGPVLAVATDLPLLSEAMLRWLAHHPARCSIVPLDEGRPQPLCARYARDDCRAAIELSGDGARSMTALLRAIDPLLIGVALWEGPAGRSDALLDVDTPDDLARLGLPHSEAP
jgi:molybdenum cofactor guanylyltransferase